MALRNLASKVGIPALRRASGPPVSPPAGTTRPLTSGSYQVRVRSSRVFRPGSTDITCRRIESWTRAVNYASPIAADMSSSFVLHSNFKHRSFCTILLQNEIQHIGSLLYYLLINEGGRIPSMYRS